MGLTVNLQFVRGYNDAAVLGHLRTCGVAERRVLAEATGLTPQAVSKILARLIDDGLVETTGTRHGGRGKPAYLYRLRAETAQSIGVHASRTDLHAVMVDLAGDTVASTAMPLPPRFTPQQLVDAVAGAVSELMGECRCTNTVGVGIATPGPVHHDRGTVHGYRWWEAPERVPLRDELSARCGLPVFLERTTNAALELVAWQQGERMTDTFLALADRGVGGALWVNGRLQRGAHCVAAEFGHTVVQLDGPRCECGRLGCVEALFNAALAAGDVERAARVMATGLTNALEIVDVPRVIVGGRHVLSEPSTYLRAVEAGLAETLAGASAYDLSTLSVEGDAVATGAAVMVLEAFYGLGRFTADTGTADRPDRPSVVTEDASGACR